MKGTNIYKCTGKGMNHDDCKIHAPYISRKDTSEDWEKDFTDEFCEKNIIRVLMLKNHTSKIYEAEQIKSFILKWKEKWEQEASDGCDKYADSRIKQERARILEGIKKLQYMKNLNSSQSIHVTNIRNLQITGYIWACEDIKNLIENN